MLTVHHLGVSQSDRIVWLCEELAVPYQLIRYERDPLTRLAPQPTRHCIQSARRPSLTMTIWYWPNPAPL
jgi:glutathione S-transferase